MVRSKFVDQVYHLLKREFQELRTPLSYKAPHELAIAVILSAQCTDEQVNRVTPQLFSRFPSPQSFYQSPITKLEGLIYSTGFYKNKARSIRGFCRMLVEDFNGKIPQELNQLIRMPGVGRKTANVILQELYRKPVGIVVDTHVSRISRLLKLTQAQDAYKIEQELMEKLPRKYWIDWSLLLIFLGRKYCKARKRHCKLCPLEKICPSSDSLRYNSL